MKIDNLLKSDPQLEKILLGMPEDIRSRCYLKNIAAGAALMRKGEKLRYVYILVKGEAKIINEFENGRLYIYALISSICFIGELEILAGEMEHASTVEAVTDCKMIVMTCKDFAKWIEYDHKLLMIVSKGLAEKMYPTSSENGTIMFLSGISKVQAYIVKNYKEEKNVKLFRLDKKRQQIADEIGISIKTVNRCVEKLKIEGLISLKKGKIHINKAQYTALHARIIKK